MIVDLYEGNMITKFGEDLMHGMHVTRPLAMYAGNFGSYFKQVVFCHFKTKDLPLLKLYNVFNLYKCYMPAKFDTFSNLTLRRSCDRKRARNTLKLCFCM